MNEELKAQLQDFWGPLLGALDTISDTLKQMEDTLYAINVRLHNKPAVEDCEHE